MNTSSPEDSLQVDTANKQLQILSWVLGKPEDGRMYNAKS